MGLKYIKDFKLFEERDWIVKDWSVNGCKSAGMPRRRLERKCDEGAWSPQLESKDESLVTKITWGQWNEFQDSHVKLEPEDGDIRLYKKFLENHFTPEELQNFEFTSLNSDGSWSCYYDEINDDGEIYGSGKISITKFDDEWWVIEKMVSSWRNDWTWWLVDTADGFKEVDLFN